MVEAPKKLKQDAIVEAVAQIQFEHSLVSEVVVGKLTASPAWAGYTPVRLPFADFPAGLRDNDPNLRFQAIIQLQRPAPGELIQIGPRSITVHHLAPYDGWAGFFPRIEEIIAALHEAVGVPYVHRTGLRYINALSPAHGFNSLWDLSFQFEVAGERPAGEFTTTYRNYLDQNLQCQLVLATPAFVAGTTIPGAVAYVDVDMSSRVPMGEATVKQLEDWFEHAHEAEKSAFFRLWPADKLDALRES